MSTLFLKIVITVNCQSQSVTPNTNNNSTNNRVSFFNRLYNSSDSNFTKVALNLLGKGLKYNFGHNDLSMRSLDRLLIEVELIVTTTTEILDHNVID